MSLFITFEGIEGSGKTTQLLRLQNHLEALGYQAVATREPGGCPLSDTIRTLLLNPENDKMAPSTELLLYCAARAQHVVELIRPALTEGKIVLCDRFSDATTVYQGVGRGLDVTQLEAINRFTTDGLTPDLTLLLDFPAEEGLRRARARNCSDSMESEGRFELEALSFHKDSEDTWKWECELLKMRLDFLPEGQISFILRERTSPRSEWVKVGHFTAPLAKTSDSFADAIKNRQEDGQIHFL